MNFRIYYINRYSLSKQKNVKDFSGYEQLVKYSNRFVSQNSNKLISKLVFKWLKVEKPRDYRSVKSSDEIILFIKALLTGHPVFYLYADKDAFLLPLLKRKYKLDRIKLFGTLHWPEEISQEFAFYKHSLHSEFNGIITLSSSLKPDTSNHCIIPHGIDASYWKNDTTTDFDNNYLILGISNRNHLGQIDIIRKIINLDLKARFILVMPDETIAALYKDIPCVRIIDYHIQDDQLKELYKQSKAVILIQNHCLASNVVLECIGMTTPLIVNNVGDIGEYLGEDYPLYLNGHEDEKLYNICHSEEFRNKVVLHLSDIRYKYDWQKIADRTLEFIENNAR